MTRVMVIIFCLFLASCTYLSQSAEHRRVLAACKISCEQKAKECSRVCTNNCPQCSAASWRSTVNYYRRYTNEQTVKGGIIAHELKSYRDPLQCRKITCDCVADYQQCRESCGGVIQKRIQAPPICQ